ncbi:MAG: hypothetical protein EBR82_15190 [Caulobacteraceae bacterium]|nr:hypothetical protein [Caulobacteraceae bacterium]
MLQPRAQPYVIDIPGVGLAYRSNRVLVMTGPRVRYEGPDRRGGEARDAQGLAQGLDAEACREQARVCFAQAVAADSPEERERLRLRGEQWMARARDWRPRGVRPRK